MVDTIVLVLSKNMFAITKPDMFEPSARYLLNEDISFGSRAYLPVKQNPTKKELLEGNYKPRLTLTKRYNNTTGNREITLKIELSLPKLLFGNNFEELQLTDFTNIVQILKSKLKDMGIMVWDKYLLEASISAIHYSKNIILTDGTTPHYLISKIKEANVNLSLDINQTDYQNGGYSYKWHCNSYEIAFYDKKKDLEDSKVSEKGSMERDNSIQFNLFNRAKIEKPFEVLRIEIRLNTRRKIRQLFQILGIQSDLTFKDLFSSQISQKVLLHYLNEVEKNRSPLLDYKLSKSLLSDILFNNPDLGIQGVLNICGLKYVVDNYNPRELRAYFAKFSQRSWYRLVAKSKKLILPQSQSPFMLVRKCLEEFKPLKLDDISVNMLNNDKYEDD